MTTAMSESRKPPLSLTDDDVIAWLKEHPDFLNENPQVCDLLTPPAAKRGKGIADFQHHVMKRLRADRDEVLESAREIVETSRANMNSQTRIHRAVLMLLEARNFEEFINTITIDFATLLDVDIVTLLVETDGAVVPHINLSGVRLAAPGGIDRLLQGQALVLDSYMNGRDDIYGAGAGLVKSQALLRLNTGRDAPAAMIAFGSRNPDVFIPGQGTELVSFLGKVVERCLRLWLDVP